MADDLDRKDLSMLGRHVAVLQFQVQQLTEAVQGVQAIADRQQRNTLHLEALEERMTQAVQACEAASLRIAEELRACAGRVEGRLHDHLRAHGIDPRSQGLPADTWNPEDFDALVATERMQLQRRWKHVVAWIVALISLLAPAYAGKLKSVWGLVGR